jgi:DNA (cytosine-5)-methyltransferase 1
MHEPVTFPWMMGATQKGMKCDTNLANALIKNQTQAVAHSLRGDGFDASEDGTGRGTPLVVAYGIGSHSGAADAITSNQSHANGGPAGMGISKELAHSLRAGRIGSVAAEMAVRRLTPRECERLQGFPDDWTLIPYRNKSADACPDGPRYKALGNSMAVPVMRWIGEHLDQVERLPHA